MRVGHNPARFVERVAQPAGITVAVVNCIPFQSGYYEHSLNVLKILVESLHATREAAHPYDVMIFDNHSCTEVRAYLKDASDKGRIQSLVLSEANVGKIGAWNFMFGAAQGEHIVFSDGDIEFRPGWLSASLELFEAFPNVGMVTARPLRTPMEYSTATLEWARRAGVLEQGCFVDVNVALEHALSIGLEEHAFRTEYPSGVDYRVNLKGRIAFVGSTHFQFMARRDVLQKIVPLPSAQPMRGERTLDIAINTAGLLRLTTAQPLVAHMGNLPPDLGRTLVSRPRKRSLLNRFLHMSGIRRILLWLNNQIFRLYFFNVE